MKRILYPALLCGAIVLIASACHKNNDNPVPITFSNLAGTYKITNVIVSNGQVSENLTDSIDQCQKDDLFHFNKDSSFYYEDAGVSCSPSGSSLPAFGVSKGTRWTSIRVQIARSSLSRSPPGPLSLSALTAAITRRSLPLLILSQDSNWKF